MLTINPLGNIGRSKEMVDVSTQFNTKAAGGAAVGHRHLAGKDSGAGDQNLAAQNASGSKG